MLEFDHCYTSDSDHRFLARLATAGFSVAPGVVEHPGHHVCRFIRFAPLGSRTRQYLEFVSKPKSQGDKPGLSFGCEGPLDAHYRDIQSDRFLRPTFEHRNYDWKSSGSKQRSLGWNFVNFHRRIAAAEIWLTEYERPDGKKPKWKIRPKHANGALGIIGIIFDVDAAGHRYFEKVFGCKLGKTNRLPHGVRLDLIPASRTRFSGVVIKAADFRGFCSRATPDAVVTRSGRKTAVIKNPVGSWDILVV